MLPVRVSVKTSVKTSEKTDEQIEAQRLRRCFADQCRLVKAKNKVEARLDDSTIAATFDLQTILQLPCSEASPFYYN